MSETTMTNTAVTEDLYPFILPDASVGLEFTSEELADDMDALKMSFQRVKMPSGGAVVFEMETDNPEKPTYVETLTGVIIHHHDANAYWPDGESEDDSVPPTCSSNDGKIGIGVPAGSCLTCALNEFGSGEAGKGKACKNKRHVYLLRSGEYLPLLLQLPPTSLRPFSDFINMAFVRKHRASYGSVVEIGLKKMDNGNLYSVATFKKVADFSGLQLAEIKAYADDFKRQIKQNLSARQSDAAAPVEYGDYVDAPPALLAPDGSPMFNADNDLPFGPPASEQLAPDLPFGPPAGEQAVPDLSFAPPAVENPAAAPPLAAAGAGVINGDQQPLPA